MKASKFPECGYIEDMKLAIDYAKGKDFTVNSFALTKSKYDAMLWATGCKNENDFINEFNKRYPETPISTLVILED